MIPPRQNKEYEKVKTGDFIIGVISDIEYDNEHKFVYQGKEKISSAVRFIFAFEGYKYKHYTRWMSFSYGEKTNLYQKYITKLVENAFPDFEFDLDNLKGMKVKTIWAEKNDFQYVELISPFDRKVVYNLPEINLDEPREESKPEPEEELPF
jgi:hypothetical protein